MDQARAGAVYVDGTITAADDARVSVFDHAFLYGDGVFETFRVDGGSIFRLSDHLARLQRSASALSLAIPGSTDGIRSALMETVEASRLKDCYVKLIVSRGAGLAPVLNHSGLRSRLIIIATPAMHLVSQGASATGLSAAIVPTRKVSPAALDPRIKSLNYLNIICSRIEAQALGSDESILLDEQGRVVEGSVYNIIVSRRSKLSTPKEGCLEGITRETALTVAIAEGIEVEYADLYPYDLATADEIIFTSTAAGVVPVTQLNGAAVADGRPGPVWKRLSDGYRRALCAPEHVTPTRLAAT